MRAISRFSEYRHFWVNSSFNLRNITNVFRLIRYVSSTSFSLKHRIPLHLSVISTNYRSFSSRHPSRINSPSVFPQRSLFPNPKSGATPLGAEAAGEGGGRGGVKLKQALRTPACGTLRKHKTERSGIWEGPTLGSVRSGLSEVVPAEVLVPPSTNGRTQRQGGGERWFGEVFAPASVARMLDEGHGGSAKPCASPEPLRPHKGPPAGLPQFPHLCLAADLRTRSTTGRSPARCVETTKSSSNPTDGNCSNSTAGGDFRLCSRERAPPLSFCPAPDWRGSRMLPPTTR